jgi:farnesyl-diphosphate farnesyltransferase
MIGIITALPEELAPLLKRAVIGQVVDGRYHVGKLNGADVVLVAGGDGIAQAERAASELIERFEVDSLIGCGIAGAVDSSLKRGDVVVAIWVEDSRSRLSGQPRSAVLHWTEAREVRIRSLDRIATDKTDIDADVIDTESSGWARAAEKANKPLTVIRVIYDTADDDIPAFVAGDGGAINRGAIVRHAILHPTTIPTLLRMRNGVRDCTETLAAFVSRSVIDLDTRLNALLVETSRTFALCIPLLGDSVRRQMMIAYLLFRIADTFEDASHWPVADRLAALDEFSALLRNPNADDARRVTQAWYAAVPSAHAGYMHLIADAPLVIAAFAALPEAVREVMRTHVIRSAHGMARYVAMTAAGSLRLTDIDQLHDYCYQVAGIVGEMCTELFLLDAPQLRSSAPFLRARAAAFGEGLQLVNILKDHESDRAEGRIYIPEGADRAEILALARAALDSATEYTLTLQSAGAPRGTIAFNALPVALAEATLDRLETSSATKISRPEVFRILREVNAAVAKGEPPLKHRRESLTALGRMQSMISLLSGMR